MEQNNLYSRALLDHVEHPDYQFELAECTHSHDGVNPSCGDALTIHLHIDDNGVITDASWTGSGCAVSKASCDMMVDLIIDRNLDEAQKLADIFKKMIIGEITDTEVLEKELDEASCLQSISRMPARVKCAELSWRTLEEIIKDIKHSKDCSCH